MTRNVSRSRTGQNEPPPSKRERDEAASKDAGRKAVEEPIETVIEEGRARQPKKKEELQEPIGLQMETQADEFLEK